MKKFVALTSFAAGYVLGARAGRERYDGPLVDQHAAYVVEHLEDMPEVRDWVLGDWAAEG